MHLEGELKKIGEELRLAKLDYEAVTRGINQLKDHKKSLVKLLAETMKRSKLLAAHLRK